MFIDKSELLKDNPIQMNYGVAVTDIDGDGAFEVFIAGFGAGNLLLKWNGQRFEDMRIETLADAGRQAIGVAAGDINGDGREEIYVLNTDTFAGRKRFADRLFLFRGRHWVDLFEIEENANVLNLTAGRSVGCVDRLGRGVYGFFIANYGGPMRLYEMGEDGLLHDVADLVGVNLVTGGRGVVALPLVSDQMDIFAGNEHGPNFLFVNQGNGTFAERAAEYGLADPYQHVRGVAPVAGGLVYGNWEGPHRLFMPGDTGRFEDHAPQSMALPSRVRTVIAADFDNDGYEEVFFNNIGQPNRLFGQRDGGWVELPLGDALEPNGLGTGAAVGDFDGDGRLELLISHGESGLQPLTLYHTEANGHHWLRVYPTTPNGAPARGAQVTLTTGDRTQTRYIDAGSGYLCQMEPVAHFGLGTQATVDAVTVRWLDGATVTLDAPGVDQVLTVAHP